MKPRFLDRNSPPHIFTLILSAGLSALTMNIFLPSLPNMAAWFEVDYSLMQLSVSLYLAVSAGLQLIIGPLSDRYGRRRVTLVGMGLFLLATLGTLMATTGQTFLIFRMGQAVIVTAMVLSRAVVRDMVEEARAASMLGYLTMGMSIAPMIGPVIGGFLDEIFGWQANFVMLLGMGVIVTALVWFDQGETAVTHSKTLRDQFRELPELFASPRFWGYVASSSFAAGSFFAYLGGGPFVGNTIFGLSPKTLGLLFGITAIGYTFGTFLSGRFSTRMGVNRMILWGAIISTVAIAIQTLLLALDMAPAVVFFGFFAFLGMGNGMVMPNATAGMLSVRPHLAGTASGIGGTIMIGGGAALAALAGALLSPESGAWPLLWIMLASSVASVISIVAVIRRARRLGQ